MVEKLTGKVLGVESIDIVMASLTCSRSRAYTHCTTLLFNDSQVACKLFAESSAQKQLQQTASEALPPQLNRVT